MQIRAGLAFIGQVTCCVAKMGWVGPLDVTNISPRSLLTDVLQPVFFAFD